MIVWPKYHNIGDISLWYDVIPTTQDGLITGNWITTASSGTVGGDGIVNVEPSIDSIIQLWIYSMVGLQDTLYALVEFLGIQE